MKFAVIFLLMFSIGVSAQTKKPTVKTNTTSSNFKIGYIFEDYILDNYTELKKLNDQVQAKQKDMQDAYNTIAIDYQTKLIDYQNSLKNIDSLTTEKLNAKLKSVQEAKAKGENFQRESEKTLQQVTGDGYAMILKKIDEAIKSVSKEKAYPYVLRRNKTESLYQGDKMVLYYNDKGSHDLSNAVLVKLGSPLPKK